MDIEGLVTAVSRSDFKFQFFIVSHYLQVFQVLWIEFGSWWLQRFNDSLLQEWSTI